MRVLNQDDLFKESRCGTRVQYIDGLPRAQIRYASVDSAKPIGEVDALLRSRHADSFARQYGGGSLETFYDDLTSEFRAVCCAEVGTERSTNNSPKVVGKRNQKT
jgi:hypothetical protein